MMSKKCCGKFMELKSVGTRISSWDLFFQCKKCGKVLAEDRRNHLNMKYNSNLKENDDE